MYEIEYTKKSLKDLKTLKRNAKLLLKLQSIIQEIKIDPYAQTHNFEILKHNYAGFCSKRLDKKNRIIYQVIEAKIVVLVISVLGHYDDR
jgi:toxin YoeB